MATFNGERYLRHQLDSFARQTLLPIELIVCDDGSTDLTTSIIHSFSRLAPFPVVLVNNPKRLGYTANFLQAARMCRGDLIAFSDQDDEWHPEKLARILEAGRESDAVLIAHAVEWINEDGDPTGVVYPFHRRFRKELHNSDFPGHAVTIGKPLLEMTMRSLTPDNYRVVASDVEIGHDVLFTEIAAAMNKVVFVPEVLSRWRTHPDSLTRLLAASQQARLSLKDRIYPADLSEKYAAGSRAYHKRSALLACVLKDLAKLGEDSTTASSRLNELMQLTTKLASVMDMRARFYGTHSRKERARLILQGTAMGQYRNSSKGGVGIHNALRDIVAYLFLT